MKNLKDMTDEELALSYVDGNNKAFDLLLSRNQQNLFSYILFVVHDRETADDILRSCTHLGKARRSAWEHYHHPLRRP